jgi:hypothetical protein
VSQSVDTMKYAQQNPLHALTDLQVLSMVVAPINHLNCILVSTITLSQQGMGLFIYKRWPHFGLAYEIKIFLVHVKLRFCETLCPHRGIEAGFEHFQALPIIFIIGFSIF